MSIYNGNIDLHNIYFMPGDIINFDYAGQQKQLSLPAGSYIFECWGAQGGGTSSFPGGKGGYVKGSLKLLSATNFYIFVGGKGVSSGSGYQSGGFNGGGTSYQSSSSSVRGSGGGSSDIRLESGAWNNLLSLRSRIMVAAAGGGSWNGGYANSYAYGGGLTGGPSIGHGSSPGTQTAAGVGGGNISGGFGFGVSTSNTSTYCGGAAGYYGGGGNAGGSSFISGYAGCNAIDTNGNHTGQPNHYSNLIFTNTLMLAGNSSLPNPRGSEDILGNTDNGFIRVTILSTTNSGLQIRGNNLITNL